MCVRSVGSLRRRARAKNATAFDTRVLQRLLVNAKWIVESSSHSGVRLNDRALCPPEIP